MGLEIYFQSSPVVVLQLARSVDLFHQIIDELQSQCFSIGMARHNRLSVQGTGNNRDIGTQF